MFADMSCKLEHIARAVADNSCKFFIWVDHPAIFCVLTFMRLDVSPKTFHDLWTAEVISSANLLELWRKGAFLFS